MPRGDFRKREVRKPKKKEVKLPLVTTVVQAPTVEVVKRKRKPEDEDEETG